MVEAVDFSLVVLATDGELPHVVLKNTDQLRPWTQKQSVVSLAVATKMTKVSTRGTGGFTKDARYVADRGSIPVFLLDLDDL